MNNFEDGRSEELAQQNERHDFELYCLGERYDKRNYERYMNIAGVTRQITNEKPAIEIIKKMNRLSKLTLRRNKKMKKYVNAIDIMHNDFKIGSVSEKDNEFLAKIMDENHARVFVTIERFNRFKSEIAGCRIKVNCEYLD